MTPIVPIVNDPGEDTPQFVTPAEVEHGPELYLRQESFNLQQPSVMIVGCGGIGVWAALALALGGACRLDLYDGDSLSLHNLNRFPLPAKAVGIPKSVALADWLRGLRPDCVIRAHGELVMASSDTCSPDWIVCATDSLKSRRMCHGLAGEIGAKYLEVGADGERWTLTAEPAEFSTELEEQAGYATVPVHVGPCMMAGAAAAYYVLHGQVPGETLQGDWAIVTNRLAHRLQLKSWDERVAAELGPDDLIVTANIEVAPEE